MVRKGTGPGADFLGWRDLPENYDREEFDRILKAAEKIKEESDVLVVIGIGGSYLGAKAALDMLTNSFYNLLDKNDRKAPQILFAGNSILPYFGKFCNSLPKNFQKNIFLRQTPLKNAVAQGFFP